MRLPCAFGIKPGETCARVGGEVSAGGDVVGAVTSEDFQCLVRSAFGFDHYDSFSGLELEFVVAGFVFGDAQAGHGAEDSAGSSAGGGAAHGGPEDARGEDWTDPGDEEGGG